MASRQQQSQRLGDSVWGRMPKVNAELFTLTYGALVSQLIQDIEDVNEINIKLEKMGHSIGVRIIDEFLAKSGVTSCQNFRETADMIAKVAFKMFLGITADVVNWTDPPAGGGGGTNGTGFSLVLAENPFAEFVELPPAYAGLHYSNILCGVIKGALEMVQLQVECRFVKDTLKGDDTNELRVELKGHLATTMSEEYSRES